MGDATLTMDDILTNVTLYWLTRCIGTSFLLHYESLGHAPGVRPFEIRYVPVPTGMLWVSRDIIKMPRAFAERQYNIARWQTERHRGGHFFAWENPEAFTEDLRKFFHEDIDFGECKKNP